MKKAVLILIFLGISGCNSNTEDISVNLTENGCNRQGTFSSQAEKCAFLKKEMHGACVPSLASQQYRQECSPSKTAFDLQLPSISPSCDIEGCRLACDHLSGDDYTKCMVRCCAN